MLTKYQETAFAWLRRSYFYMYEVPVVWDSKNKKLSCNTQFRKWLFWGVGNFTVFILFLCCAGTLATQFIMQRKRLQLVQTCILSTGSFCFGAALCSAIGLYALRNNLYASAINQYIQLEIRIYKKYFPVMLSDKLPISKMDIWTLISQPSNLLPGLIYVVCMVWDLDGTYWVIEDFAPDPKYRNMSTIILFLLIRTILSLPAFIEVTRTLIYSSLSYLCVITYHKNIIETLSYKVKNQTDFFGFYSQLYILCNVLGTGFERASLISVSIMYFLFIQTVSVIVTGFGKLDIGIYLFFVCYGFLVVLGTGIGYPLLAFTGEITTSLPLLKVNHSKAIYCSSASRNNKIFLKKAASLRAINFSYGSFCPFSKSFFRNLIDNGIQDLCSMLLVFDMSGGRG